MFSQLLFACSIEIADARELDWKMYGVGAASTALSMPLTYVGASLLTKTSNKLVTGMLPQGPADALFARLTNAKPIPLSDYVSGMRTHYNESTTTCAQGSDRISRGDVPRH